MRRIFEGKQVLIVPAPALTGDSERDDFEVAEALISAAFQTLNNVQARNDSEQGQLAAMQHDLNLVVIQMRGFVGRRG